MQLNGLQHGVALFNGTRFFDAHEALEDVWREAPLHSPLRLHLQGLVQLAVAFHHWSTGNYVGARSVLRRGLRNLEGAEGSFPELDLAKLRSSLELWREYLDASDNVATPRHESKGVGQTAPRLTAPEPPQIMLRDERRH